LLVETKNYVYMIFIQTVLYSILIALNIYILLQ